MLAVLLFASLSSLTHQPQHGSLWVYMPSALYWKRSALWLIGSKLAGLFTAKCWLGSSFQCVLSHDQSASVHVLIVHVRTPNDFLGKNPPRPPRVKDCRAAMFSTLAYDIDPYMEKVMYGPVIAH